MASSGHLVSRKQELQLKVARFSLIGSSKMNWFFGSIHTCFLALALLVTPVAAQIVTDGSVGAITRKGGANVRIPARLGAQAGENLFHSFSDFNVNTGQKVAFGLREGTGRVITRVTGGTESQINGLVEFRSQDFSGVATADFWFLNPAGVFIGPEGRFATGGGLHIASGDSVRLADGKEYPSDPRTPLTLTSAPPEAFGFMSANPGPITIRGANLRARRGNIVFVGGDINIIGGEIKTNTGSISIRSGTNTAMTRNELNISGSKILNTAVNLDGIEFGVGILIDANGRLDISNSRISGYNPEILGNNNIFIDGSVIESTGFGINIIEDDTNFGSTGRATIIGIVDSSIISQNGIPERIEVISNILAVLDSEILFFDNDKPLSQRGIGGVPNLLGSILTDDFESIFGSGCDSSCSFVPRGPIVNFFALGEGPKDLASTIEIDFLDRSQLTTDFCVAAVTGGSSLRLEPLVASAGPNTAPALFGTAIPYPLSSGAALSETTTLTLDEESFCGDHDRP